MTIIFMTIITMMGIAPLPWSVQHQGQEPTHYEAMPEKVNIQSWSDKSQRFFFLDKIIDNSFAMFFWKKRIRNIVFTSKQIQSY